MFVSMSRLFVAAAVILSLLVVSVPAQARPLHEGAQSVRLDISWFQAALSWLTGLVPTHGHAGVSQAPAAARSTGSTGSTKTLTPMTGSCIDPQGGVRCNL